MKKYLPIFLFFFVILFLGSSLSGFAQLQTNCENSNFNLGSWKNWEGCYGEFNPGPHGMAPCETQGFHPTRHVLIEAPGTLDPQTCDSLITVYPGEAWTARLGDINQGGLAEQLKYTLTIDEDSYLFIYRYAVVFEDANHAVEEQPAFKIEIQNEAGEVVDSTCGYYYIAAQPSMPGWHSCDALPGETRRWKEWTTVGMDMTPYLGEVITVVFTTRGCWYSAHQGYAYINTYCSKLNLDIALCEGDTNAVLTAPPGFMYEWSTLNGDTTINGDTTASIIINQPVTGDEYFCKLISYNGCEVTISQLLTYTVIHTGFTLTDNCAGLPSHFQDTTWVNQNEVVDWKWDFGDGTPEVTGVQHPVHIFDDPGTYDVTLISFSTEGCTDTMTVPVTIDSLPNVNNDTLRKAICSRSTTDILLSSEVSNTLFTWTSESGTTNITGFNDNSTPANLINDTLINIGATIDSVIYTITPHNNQCAGFDTLFSVLVYPLPILSNTTLVKSICDSSETNIILQSNNDSTKFTWTCTTSSANITGYSNNTTTPHDTINQIIRNTGYTIDTLYYHIVPQSYGCFGDTIIFKVAVYPDADLSNAPAIQEQCNGTNTNITLESNVSGTTFTWLTYPSSGNLSGYANNVGPGATTINQTLSNSGATIDTVTYRLQPLANGCTGDSVSYKVVVFPTPDLSNAPAVQAQCNNTATGITLQSNIANTTFTWRAFGTTANLSGYASNTGAGTTTIDQTLINSGYTIDTVVYRLMPSANACSGDSTDYKVAVYPTPDLSNSPALQTQCNNLSTNLSLLSNVANTTFTWTAYTTSANITGFSSNSGPGTTSINQILINAGTEADTVTYRLFPSANGCDGDSIDYQVIVYPAANLSNNPASQSQCNNLNANILLTSDVAGTQFTWTALGSSPAISGYSDQPTPTTILDQTLTNSGFNNETVTYTITPIANGCDGTISNFTVTVYPTPDLSNTPLEKQICNENTTNLPLTSNVTGTLFTWTITPGAGNISGYSENTTTPSALIDQQLFLNGVISDSIWYHITPHANGCDGPVYDYKMTVNPFPQVTNHPMYDTICDLNSPLIDLQATCDGTTFTWNAQLGFGNITGFAPGAGPLIDEPLDNHITTPGEVEYIVTPTAYGCPGPDTTFYILVNPTAHLTNNPLATAICSGESISIPLTADVSPVEFVWTCTASSPDLAGFTNSVSPTDVLNQTVTNSGYTIETVTYHITPVTDSCHGDTTNFVLTVFPVPDVSNDPLFSEFCNGTSTNIALQSNVSGANFSWTATPSSPNIIGWGPGTGTLIDQILTNTGFLIESVTYHIVPTANGCLGDTTDFVASVVSQPDVYFTPPAQTICSEETSSIQVLSHVTSATFTWTSVASSANLSGFSDGTGPLIEQTITNTGTTIETVTYTAIPEAFGCPAGDPQSVILTVNPTPHVTNNPLTQSICTETSTNITLTSTVAGSDYSWTTSGSSPNVTGFSDGTGTAINQTIANNGYMIENVEYTITPEANGCPGPDSLFTVTVFPRPDLANNPPDTAICSGQPTGVNLSSHISGTQFTWTAVPSSANVTGYADQTTPTILIDQTLSNTGYVPETVTYQLTPVANGCNGNVWNYTVTVWPVPDVSNSPMAKEICNNNNTDVNLTSNISGTLFTWTATPSSANITGYTDNTTPDTHIGDNLINMGDINETVTYHITPHANGCSGNVFDYTVTVVPSPFLTNAPLNNSICNNVSTALNLTSNVAGTQFSWTTTASSGNVTGYANSTTPGTLIDQTLNNSGYDWETVTYHITPENSGCPGSVTDYTFTIYPVPDVYFTPNGETICEGTSTNLVIESHIAGSSFSWTATPSSPDLSGFSDGNGALIAQVIDHAGFTIETVTYQVTPEANGCPPGTTLPVVATINPRPAVTSSPPEQAICSGITTNLLLSGDVAGTSCSWKVYTTATNLSGYSDGSGPLIAQTITNSGYTIDTVTYRIAGTANGCTGDSTDVQVVVYPVADVLFTPPSQSLCSGETTSLSIASNVANTSFTWTATPSGSTVSGYAPGSGTLIQQTLVNSSYTIPTVTYTVTPVANGCTGTPNTVVTEVYPWPETSLTACYDTLTTTEADPFILKGAIPHGGSFTGTGVTGSTFYPAIADTGTHEITYVYVNDYGCSDTASITIHIVDAPIHNCGDPITDIRDNQQYPTVLIGTQCWMAANFNYGNVVATSQTQRDNCIPEKHCLDDNPAKCVSYGGLYRWNEIMTYHTDEARQGLCPPGWHIPTEAEWNILFNQYISNGFAGNALKYSGYSGFNALLEGIRFHNNVWKFRTTDAILHSTLYWSSTQQGPHKAWAHGFNDVVADTEYTPSVSLYPALQSNVFLVRCIKD
jgi:uncharacterized protein (TIGR02145 family)